MINSKYGFTGETQLFYGIELHRIRALTSFGQVSAGDVGGWIEKEENLAASGDAWVSGDARVYGAAQVSGDAQVYGDARVSGDAWVSGDARVYGNALVSGEAQVYGNAQVYGDARVHGNAQVYGNVRVYGNAWVYGNARVYGNALVSGEAHVYGAADVLTIGPIGSRSATLTIHPDTTCGVRFTTGCFSGSRDEFVAAVAERHPSGKYREQYDLAVNLADITIVPEVIK